MKNRYFDIRKDFGELNDFENYILPKIEGADWKTKEEMSIVTDYIRKIFFNQWKQRKDNENE